MTSLWLYKYLCIFLNALIGFRLSQIPSDFNPCITSYLILLPGPLKSPSKYYDFYVMKTQYQPWLQWLQCEAWLKPNVSNFQSNQNLNNSKRGTPQILALEKTYNFFCWILWNMCCNIYLWNHSHFYALTSYLVLIYYSVSCICSKHFLVLIYLC